MARPVIYGVNKWPWFPDPKNFNEVLAHKAEVLHRMKIEVRPGTVVSYGDSIHSGQRYMHFPPPGDEWQQLVVCAGVRSGKTISASAEIIVDMGRPGFRTWVVAPNYSLTDRMFDYIWDQIVVQEIFGPNSVARKNKTSSLRYIEMKWGAFVLGKTAESPDSLLGEKLDGVVIDEAARVAREIWDRYLQERLIDRKGWAMFISTPMGLNHFSEFYERGYIQEMREAGWRSLRFRTYDNPFIDREWLEAKRLEYSDLDWRQEIEAEFVAYSGLIWPDFRPAIYPDGHLYNSNSLRIEPSWTHYRSIDIGTRHPSACCWWGVNEANWPHMYREYWDTASSHEEHAEIMQTMTLYPVARSVMSPDAWRKVKLQNEVKGAFKCPADVYRSKGIYAYPANDGWSFGRDRVTAYLRATLQDAPRHPGLLISADCHTIIKHLQNYTWEQAKSFREVDPAEKPKKYKDDLLDAFRYGCASSLLYLPPELEGAESYDAQLLRRYGLHKTQYAKTKMREHEAALNGDPFDPGFGSYR